MSRPTKYLLVALLGLAILGSGRFALAQRNRNQQQKPDPVEAAGKVAALGPMMIRIVTDTNQNWIFKINREATVRITGTAQADYLRPGMYIVFKADVDRKGNSPTKVDSLTIASLRIQEYFPAGVFPADAGFGGPGAAAKPDPTATTPCEVRGMLTSLKNGKATVNTGRGVVRVEVAEAPAITVDFTDFSVVRPGDQILISGTSVRDGFGEAKDITVELAESLTLQKKETTKPGRKKPSRDRKKAEDDEKEKAEDDEKEKAEDDEKEKAEPADGEKPADTEKPEEDAAEKDDAAAKVSTNPQAEQIVARLQLDAEKAATHKPVKLSMGGAEAAVFSYSKPEPVETIRHLLRAPKRTELIDGMMVLPGGDGPQRVTLTLMDCGDVQVFVDQEGIVQFYRVAGR